MLVKMETAALVAPVTCLEFLRDRFLLSGEGPVLTVFILHPRPKALDSLSVLQHYRIHGIRPGSADLCPSSEARSCDLAVFGGKALRLVRCHHDPGDDNHLSLELQGPLRELHDWVLDVRWLSEGSQPLLCVAVAHNSVLLLNMVTGQVLTQSSCSEGCLLYSALLLVHKAWSDTVVVGGTVFNQLVLWKPGRGTESSSSDDKAPVQHRLLGHSGVIFSISYLQEEGHLASASDDRSVRVWSVGTLVGPHGNSGNPNPSCLMVLYGHQARVFAVHVSLGKVFSAGEDGACLVWDQRRDGKVIRTLKGHRAGGVRALAVSKAEGRQGEWVATGGADGGVRLWRLEGGAEPSEEPVAEPLTDLGFSGHGVPKAVCIGRDGNTSWAHTRFIVCTDKGGVYQRCDGRWEMIWQGPLDFQSYCVMETVQLRLKESDANVELCAVGNLSGSVQLFPTSHPDMGILLTAGSGKVHSLIWGDGKDSLSLLVSGADGLVHRWAVKVEINEMGAVNLQVSALSPFCLPPCAKRWLTAAVPLHTAPQEGLWVCGDRRGSLLLFQENKLRTDEQQLARESEINHFQECKQVADNILYPISCCFGVHGKQGVTSVSQYQGLLYSTGRDGCVFVLRVHKKLGNSPLRHCEEDVMSSCFQLEVLRVQRACKGMEWLERVLFLEHEEEDPESPTQLENLCEVSEEAARSQGREARFVIVGFHAVHFVVWDPVKQERLFSVPCGGGHRSWDLWPHRSGVWPGYAALVFIKQGSVVVSHAPRLVPGQAEWVERSSGSVLREGVHGRGISCVFRVGSVREPGAVGGTQEGQWEVIVTGGEDTSLSVIAVKASNGTVKVLSVITDHISSIRAVTAIVQPNTGSEGSSHSISALVVSAGGRAQIQCYRLLITWDRQRLAPSCQVIQVAHHRLDAQWERRRNRHKTVKTDPETRYMSIAVIDERTDRVLLALSCSDGAVRMFSLDEGKGKIDLLWENFYHQRCVLSVATCRLEDNKGNKCQLLFSAATDGKVAVWHLTEASLSMVDDLSSTTPPPIPCLDVPAHQSGVNSLAVWTAKVGQKDGCQVTVASGGDDGQLTVSTLRVQFEQDGKIEDSRQFTPTDELIEADCKERRTVRLTLQSQSHVGLAHAAPLTALKVLSPRLLVSTSSDQRVSLWKVFNTSISHIMVLCSHVADAAGLAVWVGGDGVTTGFEPVGGTAEGKAEAETVDPVWEPGSEKGEQRAISRAGESGVRERRETLSGWLLVCGQGFQLLRVDSLETEGEMWSDEREAKLKLERLI